MEKYVDANGKEDLRGWPFVVPGGRFNELYGNFPVQCPLAILVSNYFEGRLGQLYDCSRSYN